MSWQFDDSKSTQNEEDHFDCLALKPRKEEPYTADEDLDMMRLLPENNQTVLYELVNKITNERKRKQYLTVDENVNMRAIKDVDPLLNEKAF